MIFQYQQIRCMDLIEVKNFAHTNVDQYLNMTYSTWTEKKCKNKDPVFGFQVNRPHLKTGERCTKQRCYPNSMF